MLKGFLMFGVFVSLMMMASTGLLAQEQSTTGKGAPSVTVFKSPT